MKVRLLDYSNQEHFVEIPDDTELVVINVISGDMVMERPVHYDTSNCRLCDFHDGCIVLDKKDFYKLEKATSSYDDILWEVTEEDKEFAEAMKNISNEEFKEIIKK